MEQDTIVFYDGDCGLCNRVIQFILKNERGEKLHFCSLQSEFGTEFLKRKGYNAQRLNTLYLYNNSKVFKKSSAVLQIIPYLKKQWHICLIFWIIPWFLRDVMYFFISRLRKYFFKNQCMLSKGNSTRFIS
jgi:predicted DCC family thiol-disulfide oxidoreductase YuxK